MSSTAATVMKTNVLYYGDNLDILKRYVPDESVDLVYLDPPSFTMPTYQQAQVRARAGKQLSLPST